MRRIKSYKAYIKEAIDQSEFPDPLPSKLMRYFATKGRLDGSETDDRVNTKNATWPAKQLLPSQDAIYLGKTIGMAIGGVEGGELGSIVSNDNRILDGHHRWAATMFNNPAARVGGIEVDMGIKDLIPVLRAMGDAYGNERRGNPGGTDKNLYDATPEDVVLAVKEGKYMNPKFYDKKKALAWLESLGGEGVLKARLKTIQSMKPPADAPPRTKMPVIDADKNQHKEVARALDKGDVDVNAPYAKIAEERRVR